MTRITYDPEELMLEVNGHAGHGAIGEDIVCAGVSALSFALMGAATDRAEYMAHLYINEKDGVIRVRCYPDEEHRDLCREMFNTVMQGYEVLAETYPDNVTIEGGSYES